MSAHTPGPWKVISDGNDLSVRSANSRDTGKITHLDIAENIGGLRPGPDFNDRSEAQANARLISASPDFLAAALMVIDTIEGGPTQVEDAITATRAAIAKATGGAA